MRYRAEFWDLDYGNGAGPSKWFETLEDGLNFIREMKEKHNKTWEWYYLGDIVTGERILDSDIGPTLKNYEDR